MSGSCRRPTPRRPALGGSGDLSTYRSGGLFPASLPRALWSNVVVAGDPDGDAMVAVVGEIEAFGEELLPAVLGVGVCGVGGLFAAVGVARVELVVEGVHAGGARVEDSGLVQALGDVPFALLLEDVEVDGYGVVHDLSIVVPREDEPGTAHVCGKLVYFVKGRHELVLYVAEKVGIVCRIVALHGGVAAKHLSDEAGVLVAYEELVGGRLGDSGSLRSTARTQNSLLESFDGVAHEAAGAKDARS